MAFSVQHRLTVTFLAATCSNALLFSSALPTSTVLQHTARTAVQRRSPLGGSSSPAGGPGVRRGGARGLCAVEELPLIVDLRESERSGLRGGGFVHSDMQSRTGEAVAFFGSERIPAAFLSGAALSVMFAFPLLPTDPSHIQAAKRIYIILTAFSFCNTILSVFVCSLGIARLMTGKHDPMAESATDMMLREIPLFFLATRAHFVTGLLCFSGSIALRMWASYFEGCVVMAKAMMYLMGATMMFMLSLFNMSLVHFTSFGDLWRQYLKHLFWAYRHKNMGPLGVMALILVVLCAHSTLEVSVFIVTLLSRSDVSWIRNIW